MNDGCIFYEFILVMLFFCESKTEDTSLIADTGIDTLSPCSVGIIFFIKLNNTSNDDCYVEITPDVCYLKDEKDDDILKISGGCNCLLPGDGTKILKLVAPILDPYERQGYCTIFVDSKSNSQINKRETAKINFDTFVPNTTGEKSIKRCKRKDEDPLNYCKPVDCDKFYNGKKPFYNKRLRKCTGAPPCFIIDETYTDIVYNPLSNKCIKKSITNKDIQALNKLSNKDIERKAKDVIIITNSSELNNDPINIIEITSNQPCVKNKVKHEKSLNNNNGIMDRFIFRYLKNYKWVVILLGIIVVSQFILICSMFWLKRSCTCVSEKKVISNFFNKYQNDSVTTPLIGTSDMNTRTLENQFSDSTINVAKRTKFYKSCDKGRNENIKISMSDDILSKCINRRDWKNHHKRETAENYNSGSGNKIDDINAINNDNNAGTDYNENTDVNSTRVVFENEKVQLHNENKDAKTINIKDKNSIHSIEDLNKPSEEELKCKNYSCYHIKVDSDLISEKKSEALTNKSKITSISSEKAAQTYFSRDSIDALLSERGYIYLAGEDLSRYTFSGESAKIKSSEITNKGSKNIIKYFHALLHRKSKQGPQSDPGKKKDFDLQLLHMSKASLYSSSNNSN